MTSDYHVWKLSELCRAVRLRRRATPERPRPYEIMAMQSDVTLNHFACSHGMAELPAEDVKHD